MKTKVIHLRTLALKAKTSVSLSGISRSHNSVLGDLKSLVLEVPLWCRKLRICGTGRSCIFGSILDLGTSTYHGYRQKVKN